MPVHDLGYREWIGKRNHPLIRPLYVARSGIMLIWRRKMLKLLLMVAWLPIIIPSLGVFCFEQAISDPQYMRPLSQLLRGPLQRPDLAVEMLQDPVSVRHEFWSIMILGFFRAPQLYSMILLIGLIAPLLVSYDWQSLPSIFLETSVTQRVHSGEISGYLVLFEDHNTAGAGTVPAWHSSFP